MAGFYSHRPPKKEGCDEKLGGSHRERSVPSDILFLHLLHRVVVAGCGLNLTLNAPRSAPPVLALALNIV